MKNVVILFLALAAVAQGYSQKTVSLKKALELKMPGETGTNGAAVVWHPVLKRYYAAFAGNATFPFAVFDSKGVIKSQPELSCGDDLRGMWYNPATKGLEANLYGGEEVISIPLDKDGFPLEAHENLTTWQDQYNEQGVASFDPTSKKLLYLDEDHINVIDPEDDYLMGDEIKLPTDLLTKSLHSTMVVTGGAKPQYAFLDYDEKKIYLVNRTTLKVEGTLALPKETIVKNFLNFSYANGIYWIFDIENRKWVGYK